MKECRRNISKSKPLEPAVYRKGRITLRARVQKKKKERVRAGEMEKEEIVITNQTEGDSRSSHFSCDHVFVSVFLFAT